MQVLARNNGARIQDVSGLPDINIILIGEQIGARRVHVALDGWRSPRKQKHDVFAELRHFSFVARAEAFADPHQQQ